MMLSLMSIWINILDFFSLRKRGVFMCFF